MGQGQACINFGSDLSSMRGALQVAIPCQDNRESEKGTEPGPTGRLRRLRIEDYRIFFEVAGEEMYVLRCVHRQTHSQSDKSSFCVTLTALACTQVDVLN